MKAYIVGLRSNDDVGNEIVFAKNSKEAMKKAQALDLADWKENYIDVYTRRSPEFDGLESKPNELLIAQWKEGWRWWDKASEMPEPEEASDDEFLEWFTK